MQPVLTIITTSLRWTAELERSITSTRHTSVAEHIVCLAEGSAAAGQYREPHGARSLRIVVREGCSISAGFNECLALARDDAFLLVLNEGDIYYDASQLVERLSGDSLLAGVVGRWRCCGGLRSARREVCYTNVLKHGLGFSHSALVVRSSFHRAFGLYPTDYKICMDYALILKSLKLGALFEQHTSCVVEIEAPGVSSNLFATAKEHRRVVSEYVGLFNAYALWFRWVASGLLVRVASFGVRLIK